MALSSGPVALLLVSAVLCGVHARPPPIPISNCPLPTLSDITSLVQDAGENFTVNAGFNFSCLVYGDEIERYQFVGLVAQDTDLNYYYITARCEFGSASWTAAAGDIDSDLIQSPFLGEPQENCYSCSPNETACLGKHMYNDHAYRIQPCIYSIRTPL